MIPALVAGLVTGLGLIVAIGAQNAFVLRQGLTRRHVATVVTICAVSDVALILAGVGGMGALVSAHPRLLTAMAWAGAAYLLWFAIRSFRSALHPQALETRSAPRGAVVTTALAITWLNPHVYLDTVVMLGTISTQHGPVGRWWFAGGAGLGSIVWFSAIGFGARALSGALARPRTWQVVDSLIGVLMLALAVMLVTR